MIVIIRPCRTDKIIPSLLSAHLLCTASHTVATSPFGGSWSQHSLLREWS